MTTTGILPNITGDVADLRKRVNTLEVLLEILSGGCKDLAEAVAEQRNRLNALEERFETLYNECSEMAVKIEE